MAKVVFVNDIGTWGGAEKILYQVLKGLKESHETFQLYLVAGSDGLLVDKVRQLSIPVHIEPIPEDTRDFIGLLKWGIKVLQIVRSLEANLIYLNTLRSILFTSLPLKLLRVPIIWHEHNIQPSFVRRTLLNLLALWLPNKIIAVSQAVANTYWNVIRSRKIQVIHNALDLTGFPTKALNNIRKEFNICSEDSIVTIPSVLRPWKGHEYFIRAAQLVTKKFPKCKFLILGEEVIKKEKGYKQRLIELSKSLNLDDNIIFTGFRNDVPNILLQSDVVVLSSILPDPLPTVVLEAMAVAKPVVATNVGGVPEMVVDKETGLLVPPKDYKAMANAILKLLMDKEYSRRLGKAGFERFNEVFTINKFIGGIKKILLEFLKEEN
ncbi:MAG: glycosyltransferase family 4 protein [Deltaproteobacteria bacterium]|nr:glycosyltransferase family 4 protein [Deltaproteobacteria bacterium]